MQSKSMLRLVGDDIQILGKIVPDISNCFYKVVSVFVPLPMEVAMVLVV